MKFVARCAKRLLRVWLAGLLLSTSLASWAAAPVLVQSFQSSTGKTVIQYYRYDAGPCGARLPCNFRGTLPVPGGFAQANVFLTGFRFDAARRSDAISQVTATVNRNIYDPAGMLDVSVSAGVATRGGQNYSYSLYFAVVLTQAGVARFTTINTGCAGIARCTISRSLSAVPPGMQYIGLGTHNWSIGSHSGALFLNTLAGHIDSITVQPPLVNLAYLCNMQDAKGQNRMYCEWAAELIAFDPAEMEQNRSALFPQYTFPNWGTSNRIAWTEQAPSPSSRTISGFLDVFEGLVLTFRTWPAQPAVQYPVWQIDASASGFVVNPAVPSVALTTYSLFFGTTFGNSTNGKPFAYQSSRAFGFLQ